jgi:formylglycine-generating enzyme required for sulfatase activity
LDVHDSRSAVPKPAALVRIASILAVCTSLASLSSCSLVSLDYLRAGRESQDAGPDSPSSIDGGCKYPGMVNVGSYCIDAFEVNQKAYAQFLADRGSDTSGQIPECAFNTSWQPVDPNVTHSPNNPAVSLDWCDAYGFCQWAGKRLCGKIGGGSLSPAAADDPTASQWYNACSRGGKYAFPYASNTYERGKCDDSSVDAPKPPGTYAGCEGGFAGIFDMSGNVWEWEDACDTAGHCVNRGGSYVHDGAAVGCAFGDVNYMPNRSATTGDTGFRCCSP